MATTTALEDLARNGQPVHLHDVNTLSPYVTSAMKRVGDYQLPTTHDPEPIDNAYELHLQATR